MKKLLVPLLGLACVLLAVPAMLVAVLSAMVGASSLDLAAGSGAAGSATAQASAISGAGPGGVPPAMLSLYIRAARACPGLSWTVLAGVGTVESSNGTSNLPGVHSGANAAGAEGPMQFEPATFRAYDLPVPPGGARPPSPYDPVDAVYATARDLCANGARDGRDIADAVFAYNHDPLYVSEVLALARAYATPSTAVVAADWALAQVGTPYEWGGETPGAGFDCSGLVQAAYRAAGVNLPRTAQQQFDAGVRLAGSAALDVGDLVFFGGGPADVSHVGMFIGTEGGQDLMVDAPHTGAEVRVEPFPATPGAAFGDDVFVGATRPAG